MSNRVESGAVDGLNGPGPEHERLGIFVGTWRPEGQAFTVSSTGENSSSSPVPMITTEVFAWMPGGFFLLHDWDGTVAGQPFRGHEVLGFDEESGAYSSRFFDDQGNCPVYQVTEANGCWSYVGELQRGTFQLNEAADEMAIRWEWSQEGTEWSQLCDLRSKRLS